MVFTMEPFYQGFFLSGEPIAPLRRSNKGQNHERQKRHALQSWFVFVTAVIALSSWIHPVVGAEDQCSEINTGSDNTPVTNLFQSNGLCYDTCMAGKYAYAILKGNQCWCSMYTPSTNTSGCDEGCPGYPSDKCGNSSKNLYSYVKLPNNALGTKGADSTTETPAIKSTSNDKTPSDTSSPAITAAPNSSSKTSPDAPNVTVVTTVGGFKTIVISQPTQSPSSSATPSTEPSSAKQDSFSSNPARVAGLLVGLLLLLLLIIAGIFLVRRHRNDGTGAISSGSTVIPAGGAGFFGRRRTRSISTLGLIGEKAAPARDASPSETQNLPSSTNGGPAPAFTAGGVAPGADVGHVYDQRLDPTQVYLRFDPRTGSSRMSVRSLCDDQDYSRRVLRLANPDD